MNASPRANIARHRVCMNKTSKRWCGASNLTGTAPIFAVWPLNSWHAAQRMRRNSARYALTFVRRAVMNAPNIKMSIVSNARKPVTSARKNAGTWQRNNSYPPVPAIPPALEQSTEMRMPKREGLIFPLMNCMSRAMRRWRK